MREKKKEEKLKTKPANFLYRKEKKGRCGKKNRRGRKS
jgi:hypothetical protein